MSRAVVVDLIPPSQHLLLSEVIAVFSHALDMAEGHTVGHSARCCYIGMRLGKELSLDNHQLWDLYYTLLLKDAGGSSISANMSAFYQGDDHSIKRSIRNIDHHNGWDRIKFRLSHSATNNSLLSRFVTISQVLRHGNKRHAEMMTKRSEYGADIVRQLGFNDTIADAVASLNECWDGRGYPDKIQAHVIPIYSQVSLLAQHIDIFNETNSVQQTLQHIQKRSGYFYNPELVSIFKLLSTQQTFWSDLSTNSEQLLLDIKPDTHTVTVDDDRLDDITTAFAHIVDAKSSYSHGHSTRVALYADGIANELGLSVERRRWLYRGAMLHDIGILGISNSILDKHGSLNQQQWEIVKKHANYTYEILHRIAPFKELAKVVAAHHERLDGKGYPQAIAEQKISLETRIITVASIFDAMTSRRPYRDALPLANVLRIMEKQCGTVIDAVCFAALKKHIPDLYN